MLRTVPAIVAAAGIAAAAAPASTPTRSVPAGVAVAGVPVGGLSAEPARARVAAAFDRTIRVAYGRKNIRISPRSLGTGIGVDEAVAAALSATRGSEIALPVRYSQARIARAVRLLAKRFDRRAVDAEVVGATAAGPRFSRPRAGLAVDQKTMRTALAQVLRDGSRTPLTLLTRTVSPRRTPASFGPVIVIRRGVNTLRLYDGRELVRAFRVATGQAAYPTPAGLWHIVTMQRNPWWYPPTTSAWAKGLKPVPPGPDNPLGTRWMGLDASGVGIHGTTAAASIGYSVSHGCIRMQVPEAEWLFQRVEPGTPVVIL